MFCFFFPFTNHQLQHNSTLKLHFCKHLLAFNAKLVLVCLTLQADVLHFHKLSYDLSAHEIQSGTTLLKKLQTQKKKYQHLEESEPTFFAH